MKWIEKHHKKGEKRTRSEFLFSPKAIEPPNENAEVRWLEHAVWEEEFIDYSPSGREWWKVIRWLDIEK